MRGTAESLLRAGTVHLYLGLVHPACRTLPLGANVCLHFKTALAPMLSPRPLASGLCADSIPVLLCLLQARSKSERRSQQPAWICADRHLCNESPPAHKAQSAWPVAPEAGWGCRGSLGKGTPAGQHVHAAAACLGYPPPK